MFYPKLIGRGLRNYFVHNEEQERQVKDFLGIDPPGVDIETYLSRLDLEGLRKWRDYWVKVFTNLGRHDIVWDVNYLYTQFEAKIKREESKEAMRYPRRITRKPYSFIAYNKVEEKYLKDFLGIEPSGVDLDTYLQRFVDKEDKKGLENWRTYWLDVWRSRKRADLEDFVWKKYREYSDKYEAKIYKLSPVEEEEARKYVSEFTEAIDELKREIDAGDPARVGKTLVKLFFAKITPKDAEVRTGDLPISIAGTPEYLTVVKAKYYSYFTKRPGLFKRIADFINTHWKKIAGIVGGAYGISFATSWFGKEGLIEQVSLPLRDALRDARFSKKKVDLDRAAAYLQKYESNIKLARQLIEPVSWLWPFTRKHWLEYLQTAENDLALKKAEFEEIKKIVEEAEKKTEEKIIKTSEALTTAEVPKLREVVRGGKAKVLEVLDGDTIRVVFENTGNSAKVRLVSINAPDKGSTGYKESKNWLNARIWGQEVSLLIDENFAVDEYGRILAVVLDRNRTDINLEALRRGWAMFAPFMKSKYVDEEEYRRAEEEAKANLRGVWGLMAGKKSTEVTLEEAKEKEIKETQLKTAKVPTTLPPEVVKPAYVRKDMYGFVIDSTPDNAIVEFNGRKRKWPADHTYTTYSSSGRIDVYAEGYAPLSFEVQLEKGKAKIYKVNLITREVEEITT
jgi:endonuclease YncB( thermonuclease family)